MQNKQLTQALPDSDLFIRAERVALLDSLDAVSQGVVICTAAGEVIYESPSVADWLYTGNGDHHGVQALQDALSIGRLGRRNTRSVEVLGPPRRSLAITCLPILNAELEPMGAVATLIDNTEVRYHEALLRDFVANVSHELKTPVGALGLLAEALQVEADPKIVARLHARMRVETARVNQVIDDLLNLSSVESSGQQATELMRLSAVIDQALAGVRYMAEHHNIDIELGIDGDPTIYGSSRHLISAMHHLLENAVKYSPGNSSVDVKAWSDTEWTSIEVTDHGIGIPAEHLDRVFERFFRVDDARMRTTGGTGLGLAIVREAIQRDGGEVRVTSREGEGTTFFVRLPASKEVAKRRRVIEGGEDG